jgi:hypothetical protein
MTITYRTAGPWGPGQGADLTAAQVDTNFYDLLQQIDIINEDMAGGVLIDAADPVDVSAAFFKFNFTDGSQSEPILLPVATFTPAGEWTNSTPYARYNVVTARKFGTFLVLKDHVTPAPPATFDPNATQDGQPLYQLLAPYLDVYYDIAISVPGPVQRGAGELLAQVPVARAFHVLTGAGDAFAYLDTAIGDVTAGNNIVIAIERNREEIGTITFIAGDDDTAGGQPAAIDWPADVYFVQGDIISFRTVASDDATASDLAIAIPGVRDDI